MLEVAEGSRRAHVLGHPLPHALALRLGHEVDRRAPEQLLGPVAADALDAFGQVGEVARQIDFPHILAGRAGGITEANGVVEQSLLRRVLVALMLQAVEGQGQVAGEAFQEL